MRGKPQPDGVDLVLLTKGVSDQNQEIDVHQMIIEGEGPYQEKIGGIDRYQEKNKGAGLGQEKLIPVETRGRVLRQEEIRSQLLKRLLKEMQALKRRKEAKRQHLEILYTMELKAKVGAQIAAHILKVPIVTLRSKILLL
mmetsp:Transcript_1971/g.2273  ORF Transcript_1971/g.2273 Transcript_1971/m.2273 type:complete len:140 (-) Transcript_1971:41-460(-)